MIRTLALLVLLLGLLAPSLVAAEDLVLSRAVLEDQAGTLTVAEAARGNFSPVGPTLTRGFSGSAFWLRLTVRKPAQGDAGVLFIRQPFLNDLQVFEAQGGDRWSRRVTGNLHPYRDRDRAHSTLGFNVRLLAPETTFYLRLRTSTLVSMTVEALDPLTAEQRDSQLDLLQVVFVTAMAMLLLWALQNYRVDRQRVVGYFALYQGIYAWFGVAVTGYLAPILPGASPALANLASALPYCLATAALVLFCRELLRPYQVPPRLMRGLEAFLLALPLELAAMALGHTPLAVLLNLILVRLVWWYLVVLTFTLRREQAPSRRMLQAFFLIMASLFTWLWLAGNSEAALRNALFGRQVLLANGLIIGVLFALILNARSRRMLQESRQTASDLRAKSDFLALVSHEIRTPLNALVGFSTLARKAADPRTLDHYLAILEQSSRALMDLVNDILDLSKLEAGRLQAEALPVDLRALLRDLEAQYRPLALGKGLEFQLSVAENVPAWGLGDPTRLRQVLANLLGNAVKFTAQGSITCSAQQTPAGTLHLEVRDTGIGIPAESQATLFQPFRQVDPSTARTFGGTGLGLAIVHSLTTLLGGTVGFRSEPGHGSRFHLELPFSPCPPPPAQPEPTATAPAKVLVVEDQEFNRLLLADLLMSSGHHPTLAEDGPAALALLEQDRFDLILLDIRMPGMDGFELARRIRLLEQEPPRPAVPILAVTADADGGPAMLEACLQAGIQEVLTKPILPKALAAALARHCQGGGLLNLRTLTDLADRPERLLQFQTLLRQDIEEELQSLQEALRREDRQGLMQAAHALKGLCGHLADPEPAAQAAWLQHNAAFASPEQVDVALRRLRTLWSQRIQEQP